MLVESNSNQTWCFVLIVELTHQGTDKMYHGHGRGKQGFDKGHLNPAHINSFDKKHVLATFTYSNAVPQYGHFNRGSWGKFERKIVNYVTEQCAIKSKSSAVMYLMTGSSKFRLQVGTEKPVHDKGQIKVCYFVDVTLILSCLVNKFEVS